MIGRGGGYRRSFRSLRTKRGDRYRKEQEFTYVSRSLDGATHYNDFLDSQERLGILGRRNRQVR